MPHPREIGIAQIASEIGTPARSQLRPPRGPSIHANPIAPARRLAPSPGCAACLPAFQEPRNLVGPRPAGYLLLLGSLPEGLERALRPHGGGPVHRRPRSHQLHRPSPPGIAGSATHIVLLQTPRQMVGNPTVKTAIATADHVQNPRTHPFPRGSCSFFPIARGVAAAFRSGFTRQSRPAWTHAQTGSSRKSALPTALSN